MPRTVSSERTRARPRKATRGRLHLHKPSGAFDQRVQRVGPDRIGVVSVDCAKRNSTWMICDFFGRVLLPPAELLHNALGFRAALKAAVRQFELGDVLVAVERTGNYNRPPLRPFRDAGYDTRVMHPFASSQFRKVEHPGDKTDDHDLGGIHRSPCLKRRFEANLSCTRMAMLSAIGQ